MVSDCSTRLVSRRFYSRHSRIRGALQWRVATRSLGAGVRIAGLLGSWNVAGIRGARHLRGAAWRGAFVLSGTIARVDGAVCRREFVEMAAGTRHVAGAFAAGALRAIPRDDAGRCRRSRDGVRRAWMALARCAIVPTARDFLASRLVSYERPALRDGVLRPRSRVASWFRFSRRVRRTHADVFAFAGNRTSRRGDNATAQRNALVRVVARGAVDRLVSRCDGASSDVLSRSRL